VLAKEHAGLTHFYKKPGIKDFKQAVLPDTYIGIRRKRTGFRTAVGVDREEPPACGKTSAGVFFISRKGHKHNFRKHGPQRVLLPVKILSFRRSGSPRL